MGIAGQSQPLRSNGSNQSLSSLSKRIPEIPAVCVLVGARSAGFEKPPVHYVAAPAAPGIQPCLIEVDRPGEKFLAGTLTVLPRDAPHTLANPAPENYGHFLSLIRQTLVKEISRMNHQPRFKEMAAASYTEPPFRSEPLSELIELVRECVGEGEGTEPALGPTAYERLQEGVARSVKEWVLDHHCYGEVEIKYEDNWRMIASWPDWEKRRLTLFQRLLEDLEKQGRTASSRKQQMKKLMERFKQRHLYLRLECSVRSKKRELRREFASRWF